MRNPWYSKSALTTLVFFAFLAHTGCDKKTPPGPAASASVGAAAAASRARAAPPATRWPVPTGPRLAVLAGQGLGPIRLRAKVETVERQMQRPCDVRTPEVCRYIGRAFEAFLDDDGRVTKIHVHRMGRDAGKAADGGAVTYGVFNGGIPPDLAFGMLPSAIQEALGKPKKVIQGNQGAAPSAAEQHVYDGMVLEYDRAPNGQLVLAGVRIPN